LPITENTIKNLPKRICPECSTVFAPNAPKQIYCNTPCAERAKKRRQRERRQKQGLCKYYGGPMDYSPGVYKQELSYCSECAKYFAENHTKRRRTKHCTSIRKSN
jgi:hypothetical protein